MESGCKAVELKKLYGSVLSTEVGDEAKRAAILSLIKMAVSDYSHFSFLLNQVDWFCTSNLSLMPLLGKVLRAYRGTSKTASKVICNLLAGGLCVPNANMPVVDLLVNIIQTYKDNIIAMECLRQNYPHKVCESQMHICYVESLLKLCQKLPSQRYNLMSIIIENMASFDTEMTLGESFSSKILYQDETVLDLTELCDDFQNKYDQLLSRVIEFTNKFDQKEKEALLKEFYLIFQRIMMNVDNTKAIQYIAFNLAESSPQNSLSFLTMLLSTILQNTKKQSKKIFIAAIQYLRSYLCRSLVVSEKTIRKIFLSFLKQIQEKLANVQEVCFGDLNLGQFGEENVFGLYLVETVLVMDWKFPYLRHNQKIREIYDKVLLQCEQKLHYQTFIDPKLLSTLSNTTPKCSQSPQKFTTAYIDRFLPIFLPKTQALISMKLNIRERRMRQVFSLQESTEILQFGNGKCRKIMSGDSLESRFVGENFG